VFENTTLSSIGGVFTAPLVMMLFPIVLFVTAINFSVIKERERKLWLLFFFSIIYSLALLIYHYYTKDMNIYFNLDRGIRLIIIFVPTLALYTFFSLFGYSTIYKGFAIFAMMVVSIYVVNLFLPELFNQRSFIQGSTALSPDRMRGTTLEASTFGLQVGLSVIFLFRHFDFPKPLAFIITISLLFMTTSKGSLIAFSASYLIVVLITGKTTARTKFIYASLLTLGVIFFISGPVIGMISSDIEKYSSSATRSTMILLSFISLIENPLGVGYFYYFESVYENGPKAVQHLYKLYPNALNFNEVITYFIKGTVEGVSTKSFTFDWMICFGFPFIYYLLRLVKFVVSNLVSMDFYYLQMAVFIFISATFYLPIDSRYYIPLFITLITKYIFSNLRVKSKKEEPQIFPNKNEKLYEV
jgi:hypothetical protein